MAASIFSTIETDQWPAADASSIFSLETKSASGHWSANPFTREIPIVLVVAGLFPLLTYIFKNNTSIKIYIIVF